MHNTDPNATDDRSPQRRLSDQERQFWQAVTDNRMANLIAALARVQVQRSK